MAVETKAEVTECLVDLAWSTDYSALSDEALRAGKSLILDTLCCVVAGSVEDSATIPAGVFSQLGGGAEATLLGGGPAAGTRLPALNAAYVNAHSANVIDADDTMRYKGHIAAATVPPALAFAERQRASGRDFLTTVITGYEIAARIGLSLQGLRVNEAGETAFQKVSGYGWVGFGSVVTVARLLGVSVEQMRNAVGIGASTLIIPASTMFGSMLPRPMTKYVMYGNAAQSGALAAMLAEQGFTGKARLFEDDDGGIVPALGSLGRDVEVLVRGVENRWLIQDACFKPYPACRFNNPAIDLFLEVLRDQQVDPARIAEIVVEVPPAGLKKHRADVFPAESLVDATFSLPHLLGAAAYAGPPGPGWLSEEVRMSPLIADLARKMTIRPIEGAGELAAEDLSTRGHLVRMPTRLRVRVDDGRIYEREAVYAQGDVFDPEYAFDYDRLVTKFEDFCGGILSAAQIDRVASIVMDVEHCDDLGELVRNLVREG
ncbi:MmgE/PrpD family protein [Aeromicrobium sp. YIM 150415]|uniref:MmgE/PrpD family protein n=1 Tax=Aeromicrobium sp. YIM 150415 TaxID=2803912 RepID=UPI001964BFB5|nr:MmgE/PrpD family protein [Aeromicrobium sp. YIM 150415]MBM9463586.1 MmgE/PrpD family protein [Aeromicrobium sp. YIM 150415]